MSNIIICTIKRDTQFTVWVGGIEVNNFLLTKEEAQKLANQYIIDGYDDVVVVEVRS